MLFNDRRKAKKAASSETKKNLSAMAKAGTLRSGGPKRKSDGWSNPGRDERDAVHNEARQAGWEAGADPYARNKNYKTAAKRVSENPSKFHLKDEKPMQANPMKKAK